MILTEIDHVAVALRDPVAVTDDDQRAFDAAVRHGGIAGATPIDREPRPGSRGTTMAFVHPEGGFGTLVELVEE